MTEQPRNVVGPLDGQASLRQAFQRVLASTRQLPSPPEVCLTVMRLARDSETTLEQMQSLVEGDIALTGRLMQVANSAFFGVRERVTSVRRAIVLLGFGTVKSLALGFFLNEEFSKLRLPGLPYEELPRYAQAASAVAETLARDLAPLVADEAACLGLLHESGVIVMNMAFGSQYRRIVADSFGTGMPLWLSEAKIFGVDHALAGGMLLQNWKLDAVSVRVVAHHHRGQMPEELPDQDAKTLWKILRLANPVALILAGRDRPAAAGKALAMAAKLFGWDSRQLDQLVRTTLPVYKERMSFTGQADESVDADCLMATEVVERLAVAG